MNRLHARLARIERHVPPPDVGLSFRTMTLLQMIASAHLRAEPGLLEVTEADTDPSTYHRIQVIRHEAAGNFGLTRLRDEESPTPSDRASVIRELQEVLPARVARQAELERTAVENARVRLNRGDRVKRGGACH